MERDIVNVGVVGCGNISGIYFKNLTTVFNDIVNVYACADLIKEKEEKALCEYKIPRAMTFEQMLLCDDIQLILNITQPFNHYEISKRALLAGKHVYVEKPLSLNFEQGLELINIAKANKLLLGGAPDTFMGAGIQTSRKLIDDGYIGDIVGATAFMMSKGHESWHPDPEFYYKPGGGPMFDMGPYYITALINLMGGVKSVAGMNTTAFKERIITSQPKYMQKIEVETPTHVSAMLQFQSGATASIITTFDCKKSDLPLIEIYGTKGSIKVPDPNCFSGPVYLATSDGSGYKEVPLTHIYPDNSRGLGLADLAKCLKTGNTPKAGCHQTGHVLEIMCAVFSSFETGRYYKMKTKYKRTEPMLRDLVKGQV
ncbi:MAG TPA: Gfo/Idh/MocA family oxidoreductase [Clostridia bacterium]|nr:MAG: putative oxidoreductase YhhX [Firmicutes bacterium ADurb.Bin146]HOD92840.1 Gfo/Idh/MocA family oxidoreductase [Clostridia bacterium]